VNIRALKATLRQRARKSYIIKILLKLLIVAIIKGFSVNVLDSEVICIPPLQDSVIIIVLTLTFAYTLI
jgi:hypothetical protein